MGHYLNNHPNPDEIAQALVQQATPPPLESSFSLLAPGSTVGQTVGQLPKYQKPAPLDPVAVDESDLPPPSQLDPAVPTADRSVPESRFAADQAAQSERRVIDVPDFSQLAANFRNTPLELPPFPNANSPKPPPLKSNPVVIQQDPPVRQTTGLDPKSQSIPTGFDEQDFAPRLKDRLNEVNARSQQPPEQPSAAQTELESVLVRSDESTIDAGTSTNGLAETGVGSPNNVVSLNDRPNANVSGEKFNAAPEPSAVDEPLLAQHVGQPSSADAVADREIQTSDFRRSAKPLVPFGLTEAEKSKLVRLRKPIDRQIKLGTNKFDDYVTQTGDTLPQLSTKYYGKPDYHLDIYLANLGQLRSPAEVPVGITLKIPVYE